MAPKKEAPKADKLADKVAKLEAQIALLAAAVGVDVRDA